MRIHSLSHQGLVRKNNEDRIFVREYKDLSLLLVVADGMGGHAAGERAAQIAADTMAEFDPSSDKIEAQLIILVLAANRKILEESATDKTVEGMGTTLTASYFKDGIVYWVHVGDSRLCLFRRGRLVRITTDHTIPGLLFEEGKLNDEDARLNPMRNMLLRFLGGDKAKPDTGRFDAEPGDIIMLSSDGLHDAIPEEMTIAVLGSAGSLEEKLDALVRAALEAGGGDNITVVAAEL
ncbi:MAG: PP2C family protein-serine/threonine phosphatase [Syntrophobacteraceae bacterium]